MAEQQGTGGRLERMRRDIQGVRARRGAALPIDRWLMIGGGFLAVFGVLFIILGWAGASRTPYVFEQIPYLISGGLLGLALAALGGLAYFAYWMTRQIKATQEQANATQEALGRIEELLAAGAGAGPNGARAAGSIAPAKKSANGKPFVTTAKGSMFHRPDCVVVAGKTDLEHVRGTEQGLVPCKICDPLAVPSA